MKPAQRCPSSTLQLARQHPSGSPHLPGSGQSASGEPAKEAWGSPWREGPLHWVAGSLQLRVRLGEILRDAGPKRRRVSLCICQRAGPSLSPCSGRPLLARPGWWTHVDLWTSRRKPRGKLWFFFFFFLVSPTDNFTSEIRFLFFQWLSSERLFSHPISLLVKQSLHYSTCEI